MYLLDTNVLLSSVLNPKRIGKKTFKIVKEAVDVYFSSISIAEIFIKQMLGKIELNSPVADLIEDLEFRALSFDSKMANEISSIAGLIGHDPFDRMIAATARAEDAILITSDRKLLALGFDWILDSSI
jgi:putative PIN family toxin of toxin-antitoxin system